MGKIEVFGGVKEKWKMALKIKELREEYLEISIEKMSEKSGISIEDLNKYEDNHLLLEQKTINDIINNLELDSMELSEEGIMYKTITYEAWSPTITERIKELKSEKENLTNSYAYFKQQIEQNDKSETLTDLIGKKLTVLEQILYKIKKPSVTLTGASSTGKSTMINHMLGDNTLPADYTPTTSISTKIIHVEDKPEYMGDNTTAIFKISNKNNSFIETHKLNEKKYFNDHLVEMGDLNLISEFGKHEGDKYLRNKEDMKNFDFVIVCYLDKPILKLCDIWDIPGTNVKVEDDYIASKSRQGADITLYLSVATQFLPLPDMQHISNILKAQSTIKGDFENIGEFENLFIIASQANNIKKNGTATETVDDILDKRIKELCDSIEKKHISKENTDFSLDEIRDRGFSFDISSKKAQKTVKEELLSLLTRVAENKMTLVEKFKENECKKYNKIIDETIVDIKDKKSLKEDLEEFIANKSANKKKNEELVVFMKQKSEEYKRSSITEITNILKSQINVDNIVNLIDERGFGKSKKGKEQFSNWFQNELTYKIEKVLTKYSEQFSKDINDKLEYIAKHENKKFKVSQFNFVANFIGTLSSIATVGAFSVYFSTLGNLGGYIFLSQIVSGFSAIGISLGGTASVATAVSLIGGPMTLVIGIAILAGSIIRGILNRAAWKKDFAKQIVKSYDKKIKPKKSDDQAFSGYTGKEVYILQCESFWDETTNSLKVEDFNKDLELKEAELRELTNKTEKDLDKLLNKVENLKFA